MADQRFAKFGLTDKLEQFSFDFLRENIFQTKVCSTRAEINRKLGGGGSKVFHSAKSEKKRTIKLKGLHINEYLNCLKLVY